MENKINANANSLNFEHIGWKYYKQIKKKAMEQEFSWSGLMISLSIAFFIVVVSSFSLSLLFNAIEKAQAQEKFLQQKIYRLESLDDYSLENYLQKEFISIEKVKKVQPLILV